MATDGDSVMDCEAIASKGGDDAKNLPATFEEYFSELLDALAANERIFYKSQQIGEADITREEKLAILRQTFEKSKSNFLARFGHFMSDSQLATFQRFQKGEADGYEMLCHVRRISQLHCTRKRHKHVRNRRFAALKRLENGGSYFSETEMMKRNPLLYEQLIGRYLSEKEKKQRDHQASADRTFVGVLMNGIERERTNEKKQKQLEEEQAASMTRDSDSSEDEEDRECKDDGKEQQPVRTLWGEMHSDVPKKIYRPTRIVKRDGTDFLITAEERNLLREEFVTTMYENFLDGKDDEFDYEAVDNDDDYDDLEIEGHDEEERYFDSEEPDDEEMRSGDDKRRQEEEESSEDELDIYMNALNQHPSVIKLSDHLKEKL